MRRLSPEEFERYVKIVDSLVDLFPDPRRVLVRAMLDGPVGVEYFMAPASTREEYHSCFPSGLMVHSLNVVQNLRKLANCLAPGRWDDATLAFVGLFHDLGKVGDGKEPGYVPKRSDWHNKIGQWYEVNKDAAWMTTSERGLYILQQHQITLSYEEYLAIRLNDGAYVKENEPYRQHEPLLSLLMHWADYWSCQQEKLEHQSKGLPGSI